MLLRFPTQSFPGSTLIPLYSYALFSVFNCEVQTFQETVSFSPFSSDLFTNHKHKTHMFRTQEFFLCVVMVLWLSLRQPHSVNTSTVRSYCLMKACLLRHEQAAAYASASRLTCVRSIYLAKHEEYCTFCLFLALWMNVVQWAGLLCCQLCFWSTPCLIVSMVSFFPLPIANTEGGTCLLQWHCSCWL